MESQFSLYEPQDFAISPNKPSCAVVRELNWTERCEYVKTSEECSKHVGYVNYLSILYCGFEPETDLKLWLCTAVLMSLIIVCFMFLGTTADKFFCPALKVLSKAMGMNEHLAGVTLLAFGNGSPDLFTQFAGLNDESRLLYSALFGAGLLVLAFVGGVIFIVHPFRLQPNNLLRDVLFFILGVLYIEVAFESGNGVTILESSVILGIYVAYMTVVMIDQYLLKSAVEDLMKRSKADPEKFATQLSTYREEVDMDYLARDSHISINVELTRTISFVEGFHNNQRLFRQFLLSVNPISAKEWKESGCFMRVVLIVKIPIVLFLYLFIPVTDYELLGHGWSKLLNCLQLASMPFMLVFMVSQDWKIYGIPLYLYTLIPTVPLGIILFVTSRTDKPPKFHLVFAVLSICGSCFIIYACASETVNLLYVLGLISDCSSAFLGCTLLAWGNSLGDLVANTTLARQGYEKMAFAACIAGPLFNSLLAMGVTFFYSAYNQINKDPVLTKGATGDNCFIFLIIALFGTILWAISTDFCARRSVGIFSIFIYILFFLFAILTEFEVIQSYAAETATGLY